MLASAPAARVWTEQLLLRGASLSLPRSAAARQTAPFLRTLASASRPAARPRLHLRPPTQALQQNALFLRGERSMLARRLRSLRFKSDKKPPQTPNPTPHLGSPEPALSLTQRFKKLSREYGWLALWVYLGLTALDFPFCFLAVRTLGVERIGHYEHVIVESVKDVLRIPFPTLWKQAESTGVSVTDGVSEATAREGPLGSSEADQAMAKDNAAGASIWTQLALAYAVHKSLIFIRIPLTAAVLPKVAKTLRGWGYTVGRAKAK
ncbi:hypothetical protein K458DRAFT_449222 [Lentithecium fluviatile CBS 122367]|uniref:DUF1279 domain-containing protein n=1 Tax=Lentithecium fluviatile CBS 122367 TaxID=1168545 RepID=A0A6G1JP60_9PLEO|nr:hypothetical protein K458DRAFT_449222 [Lentithecium fluviatile CBS 122367]